MKLRKITPADVVIFIGGLVNVIVIGLILYYFVFLPAAASARAPPASATVKATASATGATVMNRGLMALSPPNAFQAPSPGVAGCLSALRISPKPSAPVTRNASAT